MFGLHYCHLVRGGGFFSDDAVPTLVDDDDASGCFQLEDCSCPDEGLFVINSISFSGQEGGGEVIFRRVLLRFVCKLFWKTVRRVSICTLVVDAVEPLRGVVLAHEKCRSFSPRLLFSLKSGVG
jgi:hypothetical protein